MPNTYDGFYGGSTSSTTYYVDSASSMDIDYKELGRPPKKEFKKEFKSEFGEKLVKNLFKEIGGIGNIVVFTRPKSDIIADLSLAGYMFYVAHPILADQHVNNVGDPALRQFSLSIISDVLEHLPTAMSKANVIKEALATLKPSKNSYLLIIAEHGQTDIFMGEQKYLESLALFAGAKEIVRLDCLKDTKLIYVTARRGV